MTAIHKTGKLTDVEPQGARTYGVTLYDATVLDRDGESVDVSKARAQEPLTLQIDHDRSVLRTVGLVRGIHAVGAKLRGTLTFAPEGVSAIADQVARQVQTGCAGGQMQARLQS